jgi:hypothetical protein
VVQPVHDLEVFRIVAESHGLPDGIRSAMVLGMRSGAELLDVENFEYRVGDGTVERESWSRGVTVFFNPNAHQPVPVAALACTSTFHLRDGRLVRDVHGFHSLTSFMFMNGDSAA